MKTIEITVLGLTANYEVPTTIAEFDALSKKDGAALEAAVAQELAHGSYGAIRSDFCTLIEGKEIVVRSNPDGTKETFKLDAPVGTRRLLYKGEPVTAEETEVEGKKVITYTNSKGKKLSADQAADVKRETEKNFVDRVAAELGVDVSHFATVFAKAVEANPFDPSVAERKSAEARINKTWLKVAEEIVANNAHDRAAIHLAELVGRPLDVSNPETRVLVLAQAIQENEQREAAARKNKYAALR